MRSTYKGSYNSILFMNFTYLQHPSTSSNHGKIQLLLTMHFHCTLQEMSLVPKKKTSQANVTFSQILCFMIQISSLQVYAFVGNKKIKWGILMDQHTHYYVFCEFVMNLLQHNQIEIILCCMFDLNIPCCWQE